MRHKFRLGRGARWLPALGATMALAALPSVASAQTTYGAASPGFDPEFTNTPYLAWNGESVRLEKCIPNEFGLTAADLNNDGVQADFQVESWTGDQSDQTTIPKVSPQTVKLFISQDYQSSAGDDEGELPAQGGICAMGDIVANTPGLARIELDVTANTANSGKAGHGPVYALLSHEFLAAWMQLKTPSLTEMKASDFGDPTDAANQMNDPSGDGTVTAGNTPAYLDVNVQGTIPLMGNQAIENQVGESTVTLPGDWVQLADALAVDFTPNNGTISGRNAAVDWDTSGESLGSALGGHSIANEPPFCAPDSPFEASDPVFTGDSGAYVPQEYLDNGDNCTGGGPDGPFSKSEYGESTDSTIGPFDQTDPLDTDLPDGDLNSQDAPMPAALINVKIAQNSGSSSDISGVGSLQAANKTQTYSRDFEGDSSAHNLYAPFYDAYIPATSRPTDNSSGIDGGAGNDFTGFLDIPGGGEYYQADPNGVFGEPTSDLYHFWDTADLESNYGSSTDCLNSGENPPSGEGMYRQTPSGAYDVDVYTDQNGEAQVEYVPGTGAYYDNLPGIDKNADGGCDLQDSTGATINPIGTASITATAEYPYKPSNFPAVTSAPVNKTVESLFDKSLSYVPKGTGTEDQNSRIVISHAQDVDGTPYANEVVCFTANSDDSVGITRFTGYVNGVYYGGSQSVPDPNGSGLDRTCLQTDQNGNAAIEVLDSNADTVDIVADYVNEGLLRHIDVVFNGTPSSSGGNPPSGPTGGGPGSDPANPSAPAGSPSSPTVIPPAAGTAGTTPPASGTTGGGTTTVVSQPTSPVTTRVVKHDKAIIARVQFLRLLTPAHGRHALVVRIHSGHRTARLVVSFKLSQGHAIRRTFTVRTNRTVKLTVPKTVTGIKGAHLGG